MPALRALLALATLAILALSSGPVYVNALVADRAEVARHVHAHDAVAKRKRGDASPSGGHCKPRSTSGSPAPTPTPTSTSPPASSPPPASTPSTPSSSAPASTPTSPLNSGGKKWGLGGTNENVLANFAYLPNVGFYYNWAVEPPSNLYGLTYCPMLWGWKNVAEFGSTVVEGYANCALGMNEPNELHQANMSPQDAANLWKTYLDPLASKGYFLVSPACTDDDLGLWWYQQFFDACQGCQIHAVAFHDYTRNATHLVDYATTLYQEYGRPIWITEFADQDFVDLNNQADMNEMWDYAGQVANFINSTPWIMAAFPWGALDDLRGVADVNNLQYGGMPTALGYYYFG